MTTGARLEVTLAAALDSLARLPSEHDSAVPYVSNMTRRPFQLVRQVGLRLSDLTVLTIIVP